MNHNNIVREEANNKHVVTSFISFQQQEPSQVSSSTENVSTFKIYLNENPNPLKCLHKNTFSSMR